MNELPWDWAVILCDSLPQLNVFVTLKTLQHACGVCYILLSTTHTHTHICIWYCVASIISQSKADWSVTKDISISLISPRHVIFLCLSGFQFTLASLFVNVQYSLSSKYGHLHTVLDLSDFYGSGPQSFNCLRWWRRVYMDQEPFT